MKRLVAVHIFVIFLFGILLSSQGFSQESEGLSKIPGSEGKQSFKPGDPQLDTFWISEQNGSYVPLDTQFTDAKGRGVLLRDIIDRPTIILPIYFYCPSSCSLNLANLAKAIDRSSFSVGKDFRIIALSFNDLENTENSRIAKRNYLRLLPKNFPADEWKFLTGTKENIHKVTDTIGYTFRPGKDGMFIHPSALVVVGKDGMIIKYVYGAFVPGDVDMAISEALKGTPALSVKRLLGFCFNYDPKESRTFFKNLKLSVLLGLGIVGLLFMLYLSKGKKREPKTHD